MDREKLLDRIRKLLALSTSPNEHEAARAAAAAQSLLQRYQLTLADVQRPEYGLVGYEFPAWWQRDGRRQFAEHLATLIVNESGCVPLQFIDGSWRLVGNPTLVEGARLLLDYLYDVLERLTIAGYRQREEDLTDPVLGRHPALDVGDDQRRWMHGYLYGAINTLANRMLEARAATVQDVSEGSGVALLVVGSALTRQRDKLVTLLREKGAQDVSIPLKPGRLHQGAMLEGALVAESLPLQAPKGAIE